MDKIDKIGNANSPKAQKMQNEMKCNDFKSKMLENGWSPVDLPVLDEMYQTAQKLTNPQHKDSAKAYIDAMMNSVVANKEAKYTLVREVTKNFPQNIRQSIRNELVRVNQKYPPTDMEHKGTNELKQKFFSSADANVTFEKDGFNVEVLKKQQAETKAHQAPENTQQRKQLRNKKDYVVPQQTAEELAAHTRNESEKNFNIKTTVSQAVQKTFLNAHLANPYNKINDIRLNPDQQRRTVDIHHSRGTAQFQSGENVLEIDFAGSGFANPRKAAKGFNGEIKDVEMSDEEALRAQYGEIREDYPYAKPADSKNPLTKNYVRHKTEEAVVNGRRVTKERISIPGPLAKDFAFDLMPGSEPGASDSGPYKIANTSEYAKQQIINFIGTNQAIHTNKKIHINLEGHSRGAVSVSQTIKKVLDFAEDRNNFPSPEVHNRFKEYIKNNVQFDVVQRDPVPGPLNSAYDEFDYDKYRKLGYNNLNVTSIYTMNADPLVMGKTLGAKSFEPQLARGQDRIIIGNTPHSAGLEGIDFSQKNVAGDGQAHKWGYLDAETKQFYRGSGVSEMPKGIYLADENNNLIRVTNYSQLDNVINEINGNASKQEIRQDHIREMARNWFIQHPDLITGNDGMTSQQAMDKVSDVFKKPATYAGEKHKNALQNAMSEYRMAQNSTVNANGIDGFELVNNYATQAEKEAAIEQKRNSLIRVCKGYMREQHVSLIGISARDRAEALRDCHETSPLADHREFKAVCDLYCHLNAEKNNRPQDTIERNLARLNEQAKTERGNNLETAAAEKIYYYTVRKRAENLHDYNTPEIVERLTPDAVRAGVAAIKESTAFRGILNERNDQQISQMISNNRIYNDYMQKKVQERVNENVEAADRILAGRAPDNNAPQAKNNQIGRKNSF